MQKLMNIIFRHDLIAPSFRERESKKNNVRNNGAKKDGIYCMHQQPRASKISKNTDSGKMQKTKE